MSAFETVWDPPRRRYRVVISEAFHSLLYLVLYVADRIGFFDEEGIDLHIETAGDGTLAWSHVLSGQADYSIHDPSFVTMSRERGGPGSVVGLLCHRQAMMSAARPGVMEPVGSVQEFMHLIKGKRVVTQPQPDSQWALLRYLGHQYGVYMDRDFENVQVPVGTELDAVLEGVADVGVSFPPQADLAIARGLVEVLDFSQHSALFALSGLCTTTFPEQEPDAHQRVINALEKGCQYTYAFPDEAVAIAQMEFPDDDPDVIAKAARRCLERLLLPEHIYVSAEAWQASQEVALFAGTLHSQKALSLPVVDNEAALYAYRRAGKLFFPEPRAIRTAASRARPSSASLLGGRGPSELPPMA